uniref:Aquaporin-9-like n=1 Tax=Pundamilia nyererei TaxID=303518 RepID=A0A3B4H1D7_9CICH
MEVQNKRSMRQHCALKHGIFKEFLAEFLGTFVLVLFGCGSVAQTVLSRNTLGEPLTVHIGFSVGLMMAAYVAGGVSGGHVNPAVSLAMVILGKLKIWKFPFYVIAQFLGAFAGAAAVFGLYYGEASFAYVYKVITSVITQPNSSINQRLAVPLSKVVGTGMLVLCILAIIDGGNIGAPKGIEPLAIGLIIMAIGVSMGLNCGYPLNPARDLGPRLFTAVAGWGMEVFSTADNWWWIPVAGPMVGGVVAAVIYYLFIELHHPHVEHENLKDKYEMITMS